MALLQWVLTRVLAARGRLFVWVPVFLGTGAGLYFALPAEPSAVILGALAAGAVIGTLLGLSLKNGAGPLLIAVALVAAGVVLAGARTQIVSAPKLTFRYYGPVEGRIIAIDRSQSDAVRLTLDQVRLDRFAPEETPGRVRISLHGRQGFMDPVPGLRVMTTASLSPPGGPVEPGGFDFQRMAWFRGLGAVGYTRVPVLALAPADEGRAGLMVHRLRSQISNWVRAAMPGEAGAFAAAIMTGDRAAMGRDSLKALRGSNLAHLLAISGLHMGLLTGFVFAALRYGLALIPWLALRWPTRKIAAVVALMAGAFYLALSGGNVATQRAFIMVAVMFGAVLVDRRAISLRSVALAAVFVLILRPEAVTEPGFQMSFSATTALVAVFAALRNWQGWRAPRWATPFVAVLITSAVAGAATAPFAAAHFNQFSYYGLAANLLAVPVMGLIVMPMAVVAALLAPFGLAGLALAVMRLPILWILAVAHKVSSMDGALGHVVTPGPWVLPLVAFGGLMVMLMRGRGRLMGLAPLVAGIGLWSVTERPDLLISQSAGLVGVMTESGRVLNKARGEGFAASSWLENDGDAVSQDIAFARAGFSGPRGAQTFNLGALKLAHLSGRGAAGRVAEACRAADMVILSGELEVGAGDNTAGCLILDRGFLAGTGAVALYLDSELPNGWRMSDVNSQAGDRPWNAPP
ncbi:MAG TPA: ComEC/Rec2 family competence protein [Aliiroseovarius sp.]|nr:ComEC/Rec2 family competence protein [Aliiroseovarius sp.]